MSNNKYPPEICERAVRLVLDHEHEYPSQWKAICSIADKCELNRETFVSGFANATETPADVRV